MISNILIITVHYLNMVFPECETTCYIGVIPLVLSGLSYSIFTATYWVIFPELVKPKMMGTAYGISATFYSVGNAFIPTIGNYIHDVTIDYRYGFFWVIFIFYSLALFLLVFYCCFSSYFDSSIINFKCEIL